MPATERFRFLRRRGVEGDSWHAVETARHQDRPYTLDYLNRLCDDFVELHGDRLESDDPGDCGRHRTSGDSRSRSSAIRRAVT